MIRVIFGLPSHCHRTTGMTLIMKRAAKRTLR